MGRRQAREVALQALYQLEFAVHERIDVVEQRGRKLLSEDRLFYNQLLDGLHQHLPEIDKLVQVNLKQGWLLERLPPVDRAILRIATYELIYGQDVPPKAIINEAVEISKKFTSPESSRYINAVLGKILGAVEE